jgi:hypothetical protein
MKGVPLESVLDLIAVAAETDWSITPEGGINMGGTPR